MVNAVNVFNYESSVKRAKWHEVRTEYPSPLGACTDNQNMYLRVNGCMNELKDVHEVRVTEVCEVLLTKNLRGKPTAAGKSPGKSWKRFSVATCVPLGWASSSCWLAGSQLSLELSNPDQRKRNVKVDRRLRSPHELLLVVLSDSQRIGADRIVDKRVKVMDMRGDPLAWH